MFEESFGQYARRLRLAKDIGLREAARRMAVSAAYLSQVEKDETPPSLRLIAAMCRVYQHPLRDIQSVAQEAGVAQRLPASKQNMEELRGLYRVGGMFTSEEVVSMIREALKSRGISDEDIEAEIAKLNSELPRLSKTRDNLFAAEIKPRVLSKRTINVMAERILEKNGYTKDKYQAPTPIELVVEKLEGISYIIAYLPSKNGDPIVLGRSRWNDGVREITINKDLADSPKESDLHRFRFTLAHELFHVIEHLSLPSGGAHLHRMMSQKIEFVDRAAAYRSSPAERAVSHWAKKEKARGLATAEDWREWQANCFASAILMPEWALKRAFAERFDAECIFFKPEENEREFALQVAGEIVPRRGILTQSIAQTFAVSRQAMAIRLLELGLVREVKG